MIGPHWYSSEQMVVLPLVVQLHPLVTLHPLGMGLQGSWLCAWSRDAPDASVIAVRAPRRTFFTTSSLGLGGRPYCEDRRKVSVLRTYGNAALRSAARTKERESGKDQRNSGTLPRIPE